MDEFFADLGNAYAKAVKAFSSAGCRYLQLDEVFIAYLCDPKLREALRCRIRRESGKMLARLCGSHQCRGRRTAPADMVTSMHLCRGNFESTLHP